jgi:hypothetical protein
MAIEPGVGANHEAETMEELLAAGIEEDERALRPLRRASFHSGKRAWKERMSQSATESSPRSFNRRVPTAASSFACAEYEAGDRGRG